MFAFMYRALITGAENALNEPDLFTISFRKIYSYTCRYVGIRYLKTALYSTMQYIGQDEMSTPIKDW